MTYAMTQALGEVGSESIIRIRSHAFRRMARNCKMYIERSVYAVVEAAYRNSVDAYVIYFRE